MLANDLCYSWVSKRRQLVLTNNKNLITYFYVIDPWSVMVYNRKTDQSEFSGTMAPFKQNYSHLRVRTPSQKLNNKYMKRHFVTENNVCDTYFTCAHTRTHAHTYLEDARYLYIFSWTEKSLDLLLLCCLYLSAGTRTGLCVTTVLIYIHVFFN